MPADTAGAKGGSGVLIEGRHTNLGSAQRVGLGAEGRTRKPHGKEGRLVRKKHVNTSPVTQRAVLGSQN